MKADFLYENPLGRGLLSLIQHTPALKVGAWFMRSPASRIMIPSFIRKYGLDMTPYAGQTYPSFAAFFARKMEMPQVSYEAESLISPCDSLLSLYPITPELILPMKGSHYQVSDLVPDPAWAERFQGGLCMVFRLEATDYHHFCAFDDCQRRQTHFIPGLLHSVQPIACEKVPVYRLNRRWWTILETEHFGTAAQIEVGAMLVGGVTYARETGHLAKGEEMGNFELAGSTIVLLLSAAAREALELSPQFQPAWNGEQEVRVKFGQEVGRLRHAIG